MLLLVISISLTFHFNLRSVGHYLDFIKHFVKLVGQKREELEEQQLHLNVGLKKLYDTEEQVKSLQDSLRLKTIELEKKNEEANKKLQQMVKDKQEAEKQKKAAEEIKEQVDAQNEIINKEKGEAERDLARAEPALVEAQNAVQGINQKDLQVIKTFSRPPELVRLTLESIILLLEGQKMDWKSIRSVVMKPTFIQNVVEFDSKKISDKQRKIIKKDYLTNEDFTYEKVNRASKACGPLVKWILAQLEYSEILDKVKPLQARVKELGKELDKLAAKQKEIEGTIEVLEKSIDTYQKEYAVLISACEKIKDEMKKVEVKVQRYFYYYTSLLLSLTPFPRSISLLKGLSTEKDRWEVESKRFEQYMSTVVGDSVLSAAFLAYSG